MFKINKIGKVTSSIKREPTDSGESIEEMVRRCTSSNEPIDGGSEIIYTDEKEGVLPQHDIRTDRFELALDAIDKYNASLVAKSKETLEKKEESAQESDNSTE